MPGLFPSNIVRGGRGWHITEFQSLGPVVRWLEFRWVLGLTFPMCHLPHRMKGVSARKGAWPSVWHFVSAQMSALSDYAQRHYRQHSHLKWRVPHVVQPALTQCHMSVCDATRARPRSDAAFEHPLFLPFCLLYLTIPRPLSDLLPLPY